MGGKNQKCGERALHTWRIWGFWHECGAILLHTGCEYRLGLIVWSVRTPHKNPQDLVWSTGAPHKNPEAPVWSGGAHAYCALPPLVLPEPLEPPEPFVPESSESSLVEEPCVVSVIVAPFSA